MVVWFSVILEKQVLIAVQMSNENGLFKETIIPKNNTDVTWGKDDGCGFILVGTIQ
jgi:hypothetical protein